MNEPPTTEPDWAQRLRDVAEETETPEPIAADIVARFFTEDEMSEDEVVRAYRRFMGRAHPDGAPKGRKGIARGVSPWSRRPA
jgi:hypothetical protein